ncbi:MAG: hypothetical protein ACLUZZ_03330 [Alistipes inops]
MKNWTKYITVLLTFAAAVAALSSCSKELAGAAPPTDIVYNGFGEITRTDYDGYFEITRDDGVLLRVLEYNGSKEIERGERVYFKYNILPGNGDYVSSYSTPEQTVYDIRVLVFNDIHAVPIVRKSFLLEDDPHRSDSIGHDLIRVVTAAFSGNYINIGFEYFRYENGQPHMINLVWDARARRPIPYISNCATTPWVKWKGTDGTS